jgi:hypothetical protein
MSVALRGPHHFFGTATAVTEMVFKHLHALCEKQGGSISSAELDAARSQVLRGYVGAFNFFESCHQNCMDASAASAPALFSRDTILASLLSAGSHKAARPACPNQISRFGEVWLAQFFNGLALYVREHVCPTADKRLNDVYAVLCVKLGAKLSMEDLLKDKNAGVILREAVAPLLAEGAPGLLASKLSDVVSQSIAAQRGIPKPDISKVIDSEMKNYLTWLPRQLHVALAEAA